MKGRTIKRDENAEYILIKFSVFGDRCFIVTPVS
jgi:hypothetical protein